MGVQWILSRKGLLLLFLLLKPAAQAQVGKTKLFINCLVHNQELTIDLLDLLSVTTLSVAARG